MAKLTDRALHRAPLIYTALDVRSSSDMYSLYIPYFVQVRPVLNGVDDAISIIDYYQFLFI